MVLVFMKFRNIISWRRGYSVFLCSTQLSMKFFLLINVEKPTIVGILTFMSRKNSSLGISESEKKKQKQKKNTEILDIFIPVSI